MFQSLSASLTSAPGVIASMDASVACPSATACPAIWRSFWWRSFRIALRGVYSSWRAWTSSWARISRTTIGSNPKLDIALALERVALEDEYFISRKLYHNVDFYSGIIYQAMGFKPDMFTVLFAIPRMAGWLAQWQELLEDREQKIARPRQVYLGHELRKVEKPRQTERAFVTR